MFNVFFDPSSMTVQELEDKINDISMKIAAARTAGINYDLIQSMFNIIATCEEEIKLRESKAELDEMQKEGTCIFDSDNYLGGEGSENSKNERTKKQRYKRKW